MADKAMNKKSSLMEELKDAEYVKSDPESGIVYVWHGGTYVHMLDEEGYEFDVFTSAETEESGLMSLETVKRTIDSHIEESRESGDIEPEAIKRKAQTGDVSDSDRKQALEKDKADLAKMEGDLKKIRSGGEVENLTEDGAISSIKGLKEVIKNKEKIMEKDAKKGYPNDTDKCRDCVYFNSAIGTDYYKCASCVHAYSKAELDAMDKEDNEEIVDMFEDKGAKPTNVQDYSKKHASLKKKAQEGDLPGIDAIEPEEGSIEGGAERMETAIIDAVYSELKKSDADPTDVGYENLPTEWRKFEDSLLEKVGDLTALVAEYVSAVKESGSKKSEASLIPISKGETKIAAKLFIPLSKKAGSATPQSLYEFTHGGKKYTFTSGELAMNSGKIKRGGKWITPSGYKPSSRAPMIKKEK